MTSWYIPLALSGQLSDLPNKKLSFSPKVQPPFVLPVLLPAFNAQLIQQQANGPVVLKVITGKIEINQVAIYDKVYKDDYVFEAGHSYTFDI